MKKLIGDQQLSGMSGEFLTVGKMFKLGCQASVTFGNAKSIDILAYNPKNDKTFVIQVKTLREKNCFLIKKENLRDDHIYVFVILHEFNSPEEFFIIPGYTITQNIDKFFGSSYRNPKNPSNMPAINYGPLLPYKDNWQIFEN
jgi:alpha-mannosidase